ncbi:hypothetical protein GCM10009768_09500 [Leucobacter iarius]|uniref:Uncharacterized protein n=1 Tax=Leucobacter iarius TaxID=333963 RepID=A0ABP4XGZ8_9MICO
MGAERCADGAHPSQDAELPCRSHLDHELGGRVRDRVREQHRVIQRGDLAERARLDETALHLVARRGLAVPGSARMAHAVAAALRWIVARASTQTVAVSDPMPSVSRWSQVP